MTEWSLRAANERELAHLKRNLVAAAIGGLIGILLLWVLEAAVLARLGAAAAIPVAFILTPWAMFLLVSWNRRRQSKALEAAVIVGTWLAKEGLVDPEGVLTPRAQAILDAHGAINSPDAGYRLAVASGDASTDRDREVLVALAAFADARQGSSESRVWLEPFVDAVAFMDVQEVRDHLSAESKGRLERIPRWAWLILAPLVVAGAFVTSLAIIGILFSPRI